MKLVPFNRRNLIRRNDFDGFYNVLDDFFSDTPLMQRDLRNDTFKLDIEEKDKEYILEADLPGIDKDEIDINLDKGRLTISITREDSEDVEEKNYIHKERRYCSMSRAVYLDNVSEDDITANLEDGVLNITIPKLDKEEKSKKIEIR
ncbi:MAG TPA: Hsp20/alpha crystallin family protein [Erysipelotrichaceae bacterium]|nr:Hsp20/alpha crystallin family protein [Erysipelotrichaceae bacterium]